MARRAALFCHQACSLLGLQLPPAAASLLQNAPEQAPSLPALATAHATLLEQLLHALRSPPPPYSDQQPLRPTRGTASAAAAAAASAPDLLALSLGSHAYGGDVPPPSQSDSRPRSRSSSPPPAATRGGAAPPHQNAHPNAHPNATAMEQRQGEARAKAEAKREAIYALQKLKHEKTMEAFVSASMTFHDLP